MGTGLFALAGIGVAAILARQDGRRLTMLNSWVGAACGVGVALLIGSGALAVAAPAGTWAEVRSAIDSATTEAERQALAESGSDMQGAASVGTKAGTALGLWMIVVGAVFGLSFLACLSGTVAWLALLPLHFAYSGRWMWVVDPP